MIVIGSRAVGGNHPPFVIGEISGNHGGSLERALAIVDAIAASGADAVKLQTYTADTMTLESDDPSFVVNDESSLWRGARLYDLYDRAHTPWEWHEPIFKRAEERGLIAFSTPFDATAVEFLQSLSVPCFKIASFENTHLPLISQVAATGKPMIISTGMATTQEIAEAVETARTAGCKDLILLKCTSTYPAVPESSNLAAIPMLRDSFGCEVGLSDHTLGIGVAVASVALGATVIEKHITMSREDGAVDSAFSSEPDELKLLVEESQRAWKAKGVAHLGPSEDEIASLKFRRSLYFAMDLARGTVVGPNDVKIIRPAYGLAPKHYSEVIGRKVTRDVLRAEPVTWEVLD